MADNGPANEQKPVPAADPEKPKPTPNLESLLRSLPTEDRAIVIAAVRQQNITTTFDGPIPPPEFLAEYEKVLPGSADRILKMAESEGVLRAQAQQGSISRDKLAIYCGTSVQWGFFALAALALFLGHAIVAVPLGLGGLAGMLFQRFRPAPKGGSDREQN